MNVNAIDVIINGGLFVFLSVVPDVRVLIGIPREREKLERLLRKSQIN